MPKGLTFLAQTHAAAELNIDGEIGGWGITANNLRD